VEVAYSGVCGTQLLEARGLRGPDPFLPHLLGHEGSGRVAETGPSTAKVRPGDRVLLSWMKGSGADVFASVYGWGGRKVNSGAIATFSRMSVISENRLSVLPREFPLREAAFFGCAVPTGFGMVFNALRPRPGSTLAVFGTGGVGLCAVAAARLAGCAVVAAVDGRPERLEAARRMGATHCVEAGEGAGAALKSLAPAGFDCAVEASGRPEAMAQALGCVRPRGGAAVVAGNARFGECLRIDPRELNAGKRLLGTWGGDNDPDRDFPAYLGRLSSGDLDLSPLLSEPYPLSRADAALDDLEAGRRARPLIDLSA
jgi:S-(hydroxymethyl)glutathione dehydrogenase/alcohol dehydrogenase